MNFELDQIYTFKLNTGEEIVARLLKVSESALEIENPITAVFTGQGLQLMPSMFTAKQEQNVQLNKHSWTMIAPVRDDVRNSWIQATTGITTASKQIITG